MLGKLRPTLVTVKIKPIMYCVLLAAISLLAVDVTAQTAAISAIGNTTTTPVAGVPHNYITGLNEVVNPANGALSIRIMANVPHERGVNWPYLVFGYESNSQYTLVPSWTTEQTSSGTTASLASLTYGFPISEPNGQLTTETVTLPSGNGVSTEYVCEVTSPFMFYDREGGIHNLGLSVAIAPNEGGGQVVGDCSKFPNAYNEYVGGDEQFKAQITNANNNPVQYTVVDNHGDVYGTEDSNGNLANSTGRTWTTTDTSNGYTLQIPGVNGPYTFTDTSKITPSFTLHITPVSGATGCNGITTVASNGSSSSAATTEITLPNGESYQFQYDPTFGLVDKIIYPTGAWVEYTWSVISSADGQQQDDQNVTEGTGCPFIHDWFAITKRVVGNYVAAAGGIEAVEEQDFSYTTNWPGGASDPTSYDWTSKATTVTTKDLLRGTSFETVYTYLPVQPPHEGVGPETLGVVPQENTITYQGTNGSVLKTITKTWLTMSLMSGECVTLPNGKSSGIFYTYEPYTAFGTNLNTGINPDAAWTNLPTDVAEYDYGQVTTVCQNPGTTPVKDTKTTYASFGDTPLFSNYASIVDRPSAVQVYSNGNLLSETDYTYAPGSGTYISAYGHDDSNYGSGSTAPRGNPTKVTRDCFVSGCTPSTATYTYDTTGNVTSVTDGCGNSTCSDMSSGSHTTQYSYADNYTADDGTGPGNTYAYVTKITDPLGHSTEYKWGFNDGRLRSKTDVNNQTTTFCYTSGGCGDSTFDPFFRLTGVQYPENTGGETVGYSDAGPTPNVQSSVLETSSTSMTTTTTYDALGNPIQVVDPAGSAVKTVYDGLGRVWTVTNPYVSTSDPAYGVTTDTYDSLGRKTIQTQQDGTSKLQWCYDDIATQGQTNCSQNLGTESGLQNDAWVDYSDETGRHWQQITDGLGHLVAVVEPNPGSGSPLETDYQYDAQGNLLKVDQWGGPYGTSGDRQRSFSYDSLSRLLSSTNPESGTISYSYDANGNVISKTSPAPNSGSGSITTSYIYDVLNRLLSKRSNDGAATPAACYQYDTSSLVLSGGNLIGRLTNEWTQSAGANNGTCAAAIPTSGTTLLTTKSILAYDPVGRIQSEQTCVFPYPTCAATATPEYPLSYTYDLAGHITSYSNGNNSILFTNNYDGAGRLSSLTSSWSDATHPGTLFSLPSYDPAGQLTAATYGTGLTLTRTYDNRLRVTGESDHGGIAQTAIPGTATITVTGTEQTQ